MRSTGGQRNSILRPPDLGQVSLGKHHSCVPCLGSGGAYRRLLHERRKRNDAELEARHRMTELAHVNRQAKAGELSSSLAHELNQPLGAILTNTETAELIMNSPAPDMSEIREIFADIKRDNQRAPRLSVICAVS